MHALQSRVRARAIGLTMIRHARHELIDRLCEFQVALRHLAWFGTVAGLESELGLELESELGSGRCVISSKIGDRDGFECGLIIRIRDGSAALCKGLRLWSIVMVSCPPL